MRRVFEDLLGVLALLELEGEEVIGRARVDLDGVVGHGVECVHVGRQLLELDLDLGDRRQGLLRGVGADDGQSVAVLEHFRVAEDRPFPAVGEHVVGVADEAVDAVLALDVPVRDDLEDARHLLGLGDVDGEHVGVRHVRVDDGAEQGARRHLELVVGAVVDCAGDLGEGRRSREARVPDVAVGRNLVLELFSGHLAAQHLGGVDDGVDERLVAGAAAHVGVLLPPVADLFAGRVGVLVEKRLRRDDEPGRAVAALGAAVEDPGELQGVEPVGRADALDGRDLRFRRHALHGRRARAHDLAVQDHRTRAALALAAGHLGAGQAGLMADHVGQLLRRIAHDGGRYAVDAEKFPIHA